MLPRAQRLDTTAFAKAFAAGRTARHPLLTVRIYLRVEETDKSPAHRLPANPSAKLIRAAFVVPKKHAKAAQRNRLRRRLRECYRSQFQSQFRSHLQSGRSENALETALPGCDLIFVAAAPALSVDNRALADAFSQLLRRASRLACEMKREQKQEHKHETKRETSAQRPEPKNATNTTGEAPDV